MAPDGQTARDETSASGSTPASGTAATSLAVTALRWSAFVCILAVMALWMGPYIWRADLFSEDAAQHIFWFWRFVDPSLLANDPAADYFSSPAVAPWGYRHLYALIVPALGPQLAGELVAVALLGISCVFAWMTGIAPGGERRELRGLLAVVATLALIAVSSADLFSPMGFQRTFALPITLLMVWALVSQRYAWVGVSWLLAALTYPVILPVLGLAAAVVFALDLVRERRMPAAWKWNAIAAIAAIAAVVLSSVPLDWVGPQVTLDQARAMPEFGPGGRLNLEGQSLGYWISDHRYGIGWPAPVLAIIAAAAAIAMFLGGRRHLPRAAWSLAITGAALWGLAHLTLFHLYLPNRHTRTAVAVFGIVAIAAAICVLLARVRSTRLESAVAFAAPVIVVLIYAPISMSLWRTPVDRNLERTYAAIAMLPPGTLVAADPDLADFIPLRTGRAVLASSETALPFMPGYYARMKPRVAASLRAAYARDWNSLVKALEPYQVDVVLLGPRAPDHRARVQPFEDMAARLAAVSGDEPALRGPPVRQILLRSGDYTLIQLHDPEPGVVQASALLAQHERPR